MMPAWGSDLARWIGAAVAVVAWLALCGTVWWRWRRGQLDASQSMLLIAPATTDSGSGREAVTNAARVPETPWLVAFASQTGTAERLARQTAEALHAGGASVQLCPLGQVTPDLLAKARQALFVVATYGEGDPPDNAAAFVAVMSGDAAAGSLAHLRVAVLALGDSTYKHYCGFGRRLSEWLLERGASELFERVEVDDHGVAAIESWQRRLVPFGLEPSVDAFADTPFEPWKLVSRRLLNPGSTGEPVHEVTLASKDLGHRWDAGDLVQVLAPGDPSTPREYSIASLPRHGAPADEQGMAPAAPRMLLLVRQQQHRQPQRSSPQNQPQQQHEHRRPSSQGDAASALLGVASGWLTATAPIGAGVMLRLRPNRNFQIEANAARPLVLIGNGSGMAGLRAHLEARATAPSPAPVWLLFGERQREHDYFWQDEIESWQRQGIIERVDLAFSRDQPRKVYVQDLLRAEAERLGDWLARGAAIYVCGSLNGMAGGVHQVLIDALGRTRLDRLIADGRYRRDVY